MSATGEAVGLVAELVRTVLPLVPEASLPPFLAQVKDFWGKNNLGPMPPDLAAWAAVDAKIDRELDRLAGKE